MKNDNKLIKAHVNSIYLHPTQRIPVVFVSSEDEKIVLSMVIGFLEAQAILSAWQKLLLPRPLTADLLHALITEDFNAHIDKVIIHDVRDGAYVADLVIKDNNKTITRDCRPSDALALALRAKTPLYISEEVIKKTKGEQENIKALLEFLNAEAEDSEEIIKF